MKSKRLPDAEFEVMDVIWKAKGPVKTATVMDKLGRSKQWKIQTVVTLFSRLSERGFLQVEKGPGRERLFLPLITREEYLRYEIVHLLSRYPRQSPAALLQILYGDSLAEEELGEIVRWAQQQQAEKDASQTAT